MFTVSRENTVKSLLRVWKVFENPHRLLALWILICSWKIGNKITLELWAFAHKGLLKLIDSFFRPILFYQYSILGCLRSTGIQSRINCPRSFSQRLNNEKKILCYYINYNDFSPWKKLESVNCKKIFLSYLKITTKVTSKLFGFILGNPR